MRVLGRLNSRSECPSPCQAPSSELNRAPLPPLVAEFGGPTNPSLHEWPLDSSSNCWPPLRLLMFPREFDKTGILDQEFKSTRNSKFSIASDHVAFSCVCGMLRDIQIPPEYGEELELAIKPLFSATWAEQPFSEYCRSVCDRVLFLKRKCTVRPIWRKVNGDGSPSTAWIKSRFTQQLSHRE